MPRVKIHDEANAGGNGFGIVPAQRVKGESGLKKKKKQQQKVEFHSLFRFPAAEREEFPISVGFSAPSDVIMELEMTSPFLPAKERINKLRMQICR